MPRLRATTMFFIAVPLLALRLVAQATPAFEAASVKPNTSGERRQSQRTDGRIYRATNVPARTLILQAYGLMFDGFRLVGAPDWTNFERYDVTATMPENTDPTQMRPLLRALLADRFKLVTHTEVRDSPAYALVFARKDKRLGPNLRASSADCGSKQSDPEACHLSIGEEIKGRGQSMDSLARTLLQFVGRTVVDQTGLAGNFDFEIRASELAGDEQLPSIFTAITEQLGLKLESTRAPVELVVVDSMDRATAN